MNRYVGDEPIIRARLDAFRCPSDIGCKNTRTGQNVWAALGADNASGFGDQTCYGFAGTSYAANTWMHCEIGSLTGFYAGVFNPAVAPPRFRPEYGPQHIIGSTSRFILIGDIGQIQPGRMPIAAQSQRDMFAGWWHGSQRGNMGFADGSARIVKMGAMSLGSYTFYLDPSRQDPAPAQYYTPETP